MTITSTSTQAFEVLEMDIVGPLSVTISGNRYIFTLQTNSTKYSDTLPLIDTTAKMVATSFDFEFICRFGFPQIKQIRSTAFRSQTMSLLETSYP